MPVPRAASGARVWGGAVQPQADNLLLPRRESRVVMNAVNLFHQGACGAADGPRGVVAETVSAVAHLASQDERNVAVGVPAGTMRSPDKITPPGSLVIVVALETMLVEDGLDVPWKVEDISGNVCMVL